MNNLTIVYHLFKQYKNLNQSLKSLAEQSDKNFDLIIITDGVANKIKDELAKYDLNEHFKNFKLISISKNVGSSYSYNLALKHASAPYIFYYSSNVVLENNFVEIINKNIEAKKADMYIFRTKDDTKLLDEDKLNNTKSIYYPALFEFISDKVFSLEFLKKNKIEHKEFQHFTFLYAYDVFSKKPKISCIKEKIATIHPSEQYYYNLYDLVYQCEEILNNYSEDKFYLDNKSQIDYLTIRTILTKFLPRIYTQSQKSKDVSLKTAILFCNKWLKEYLPDWKQNAILNNKNNLDSSQRINFMKNFSGSYKVTYKFFKDKKNASF